LKRMLQGMLENHVPNDGAGVLHKTIPWWSLMENLAGRNCSFKEHPRFTRTAQWKRHLG
jgi:hypothetical protein